MKITEVNQFPKSNRTAQILTEGYQDLTETQRVYLGRWEKELWPLLEEFKKVSEASLTADEIQAIFKGAETQSIASGDNKTALGKVGSAAGAIAKLPVDIAKKVDAKINELGRMAQNAGPIKNMDQKFEELKKSLNICIDENIECPDESFAIEYLNLKTSKVKGRRSNIKITEYEDIDILNKFLTRSGIGFDLHKYDKGSGIILGGYKINCDYKIIAHSDGDVLLHSIADSILGASGLGDIGKFFPDQDDINLNLDSSEIINFCLKELKNLNLEIYNVDATIICEEPKINPHRENILKSLSSILKIPIDRIGLKATTSEKIGIIGNNEAIAVQSLINLKDK